MKVSCSKVQLINTCGRQFRYRYVERLDPIITPFSLLFGRVIDGSLSEFIRLHALNESFDLVTDFNERFEAEFVGKSIKFPQNWDLDAARSTGVMLAERFPETWAQSNLVAVIDATGEPVVQKRILAPIPNTPHEIDMVLDLMVMDLLTGRIAVLDLKTAAAVLTTESPFGHNAFQLTTYQYGADWAYAKEFGDQPIANVGYMELIKRKVPKGKGKGPTAEPPNFFPRRTEEQVRDMLRAYLFAIRDIESKRFTRATNLAFNSPCLMCDYAQLCVHNDAQGVQKRPDRTAA